MTYDAGIPPSGETLTIYDGNASFYQMGDRQLIARRLDPLFLTSLARQMSLFFCTDQYLPGSVKSMEMKRRGSGEKLLLKRGAIKRLSDWKSFMSNDENKTQFIQLLLKMWSSDNYALRLQGRQLIVMCENKADLLTSEDGQKTVARKCVTEIFKRRNGHPSHTLCELCQE